MLIILLNVMWVTAACRESQGNMIEYHDVCGVVTLCGIKRDVLKEDREWMLRFDMLVVDMTVSSHSSATSVSCVTSVQSVSCI